MIKSMTAYGRGEHRIGDMIFTCEIKSLNHRFMDIQLRMPKSFQLLEKDLRALVSSTIRRGRIEISFDLQTPEGDAPYDISVNIPLAESYFRIFKQLSDQFGLDREFPVESLFAMRDVVAARPVEMAMEQIKEGTQEALIKALFLLDEMRKREGEAINKDFLDRMVLLERYLHDIETMASELVEIYRTRLKENVNRMLKDVSIDEGRLAQEVALFSEKSDITEEIVRTRSHLAQFKDYLAMEDGVGRRLDFLIQEINREVNTIGSKTSDSIVSKTVVEMKAELERLREQVQNVE